MIYGMISFLIVNWNGGEIFKKCINSIQNEMEDINIEYEIIVVDNNSNDLDENWLGLQKKMMLIRNNKNLGFAKGTNQTVRLSTGDILFFLNNDVILQKHSVKILMNELLRNNTDAVVPVLLSQDCKFQKSIRNLPTLRNILFASFCLNKTHPIFDKWYISNFNYNIKQKIEQPMFSSIMMKRTSWEKVGEMDENFPLLFNDVDWFFRFKLAKLQCYYIPDAKVIHLYGMSINKKIFKKVYLSTIAMYRYFMKHYDFNILKKIVLISLCCYTFLVRNVKDFLKYKIIKSYTI